MECKESERKKCPVCEQEYFVKTDRYECETPIKVENSLQWEQLYKMFIGKLT